jgi:hypothetical protein
MTAEAPNAPVTAVSSDEEKSTDVFVSLAEALERSLPLCDNNPFEVANWLNLQQQHGKIRLLGDNEVVAPNANPSILSVMARISPDGKTELYIEVRRSIDRCYKRWGFERDSFEASLPGIAQPPTHARRGRKPHDSWKYFEVQFYLFLYDDDVSADGDINVEDYAHKLIDWGDRNLGQKATPRQTMMRKRIAEEWVPFWRQLKKLNK